MSELGQRSLCLESRAMESRSICVFAGARVPIEPLFIEAAKALGAAFATRGITLVYGGSASGMMGALADAALAHGGRVLGVIPDSMVEREWAHSGLSELHVVRDMHARKAKMNELSDAFVVLPGGIGTLEELFEMYTWAQLGFHNKPIALLDIASFYAPLLAMLDRMVEQRFLDSSARAALVSANSVDVLLSWLDSPVR
jgi:uncharacterized protein (TIGR00730 family)